MQEVQVQLPTYETPVTLFFIIFLALVYFYFIQEKFILSIPLYSEHYNAIERTEKFKNAGLINCALEASFLHLLLSTLHWTADPFIVKQDGELKMTEVVDL